MKIVLITMSSFILLSLGILVLFTSCNNSEPEVAPYRDAPTQFIVVDIATMEGMKEMSTYYVEVIDVNDLVSSSNGSGGNLKYWFCDTIGKYKLGQPIHFDKTR